MIYRLAWLLCRFFFRFFLRWRVVGPENVPARGAVMLASNHISNLDPPVVAVGIWRPCAFMAKEELFAHPFFGWFISKLHAFPVKRGTADRASLKFALETLEQGKGLVMFPEGTRSETGELQEAEIGVGMIACRSGAPVVPVYVRGTNEGMPKGGGIKMKSVLVRYGKPISFAPAEGVKPGREEYESAARGIMDAIRALRDDEAASA